MLCIGDVCSLGPYCHSSQLLKRVQYKRSSYPFDWIFSDCNMILECLEDNFKTFLDKSYYVYRSNKVCGHTKYNDRMFNHRNPMTNSSDYAYYIRCVDRFNRLLSTSQHKLFIMMFVNMNWIKVKEIIEFNDKFQKYTHNYTLLIIFHKKRKKTKTQICIL